MIFQVERKEKNVFSIKSEPVRLLNDAEQKKRGNELSLVAKFAIACNITDMSNRSNLIH